MAEKSNTMLLNLVEGEYSPLMAGRTDLATFLKSLSWCQNFIILPQGGVEYRPGTFLVGLTKNNQNATIIPFQFSAKDALIIIATDTIFRFYRNDAVVLNSNVTITDATKANPCVITADSHGYSNGQEVYINGIVGTTQLNDRFFLVANATTNTFSLQDQFGNAVDSTNYGTYVSGGTVASIYELTTPYLAADLQYIRVAQVGDVMYIVCANPITGAVYPPEKLIRTNFTSWTIGTFSRTNDPFGGTAPTISGVTQANPGVVTLSATTGIANGDIVYITGVVGMTQLNGNFYTVSALNTGAGTIALQDLNGVNVDTTGYGAYSSAGVVTDCTTIGPATVAFTGDGRLAYANSKQNPSGFWASELASGTSSNFDNFTTGSTNSDAMIYALSPVNGIIDNVQDMIQFSGNIAFLNASTIELMFGAAPGTPPTPTTIGTQPTYQGANYSRSLVVNWDLIFIDVNQKKLRGLQFNLAFEDYAAKDYNIAAEHLGKESPFTKIVWTKGIPDIIWVLRADGVLLSLTFNNIENIAGWARHYPGGRTDNNPNGGSVIDIGAIRNSSGNDELWMIVQRVFNGVTFTSVEVLGQWPTFPGKREFYTGPGNQATDLATWQNAAWEQGKDVTFLDMALTYDGHDRGIAANATVTPSAVSGNITLTSNNAVFQAADVGQQFWKDYGTGGMSNNGIGGGQAIITAYNSATSVNATISEGANFNNTAAIPAGSWGIAVNQINNLQLYEGQSVGIQTDGAAHPSQTVTNGIINLQWFAEIIQVGFGYVGLMASQNIAPESKLGPTAAKPRNIKRVRARFCDTVGAYIGSSEYTAQQIVFRQSNQVVNRCPPPFTGVVDVPLLDDTNNSVKQVVIVQSDPTPCTITALDVEVITTDPP